MKRRDFLSSCTATVLAGFTPWTGASAGPAKLQGYIRTNWSRDRFALGAYSHTAQGATQGDRAALYAPVDDRVFFAGEATLTDHSATVHAAHVSGQRVAKKIKRTGHSHIAVVGAGMAGLTVAHQLSTSGADVTVFEGRDRIGGRLWTDNRLGVPLDLGASWIHGTRGNPITGLARRAGMRGTDTDDSFITRGKSGTTLSARAFPDWLEEVAEVQHSFGAGLSEINLQAYENEQEFSGPDRKFQNGYSDVLRVLSGPYDIRLKTTVRRIDSSDLGVRIDGALFDACVVTVPLGVLKAGHIRFTPSLPKRKRQAIARLGMGLLDKVYLLYDQAFWDQQTWILTPQNDLPQGQFNQWFNLHRYWGVPVIMAFNGAGPARDLARLADTEIVRRAEQTLALAYP